MLRCYLWTGLFLVLLAGPTLAAAAPVSATALFKRLETAAQGVKTIASDFTQKKRLAIFDETLTSHGRFAFAKPDRLRWELVEPVKTGFVLNGERGRRWHGRAGTSEAFDIRNDPMMRIVAEQLLAWARADFDWLRARYQIEVLSESPATLKLLPHDDGGFLGHLKIVFAAADTHVQQVELHEQDGDATVIRFTDAAINQSLPEGAFSN